MKTEEEAFNFVRSLRDTLKGKGELEASKHLEALLRGDGASTNSERVAEFAMGLESFLKKYDHLIDDLQKQKVSAAREVYLQIVSRWATRQ